MSVAISVFIPAYNAENMVEATIVQTYTFLESNFSDFELILVDDTSNDFTTHIVEGLMQDMDKLKLVKNTDGPSRRENLGKAMYEYGTKETLIYFDCDLAVPLEHVLIFAQEMASMKYDICIGSRYKGIRAQRSLYRMFLSRVFNFFLKILFASKVNDHICGFKAFKKDSFKKIYEKIGYDHTLNRGWFWDAELLIKAQRFSMSIKEIPVSWRAGKESTFSFGREIKLLQYILKKYGSINKVSR